MISNSTRLLRLSAGLLIVLLQALPCADRFRGRVEAATPAGGDLMIRDFDRDIGDPRNDPVSAWPASAFSPDIGPSEVFAGRDNLITVRVRNRGGQPVHEARVYLFYYHRFTTNPPNNILLLGPPEEINPPLTPGGWVYIGFDTLRDVAPGQEVQARISWRPTQSGHTCLVAIIRSAEDPFQYTQTTDRVEIVMRNNNVANRNYAAITFQPEPPQPQPAPEGPTPKPAAIIFHVANQDRCQPKRVDLVIDARQVPEGARVAVVLPGVHHSVTAHHLRPGAVAPDQLARPADACRAAVEEAEGAGVGVACVPAFYLIPGCVGRIADIPVLPGHAVPAQLVVAERPQLAPGASFLVYVAQHEGGVRQGDVIIEVSMAQ